jgi:hypothetical protein
MAGPSAIGPSAIGPSGIGPFVVVLDIVIVTETWEEPAPGLIFVLVLRAAVITALIVEVVA